MILYTYTFTFRPPRPKISHPGQTRKTKKPSQPQKPTQPQKPSQPQKPTQPQKPSQPQKPFQPQKPSQPQKPTQPPKVTRGHPERLRNVVPQSITPRVCIIVNYLLNNNLELVFKSDISISLMAIPKFIFHCSLAPRGR